MKNLGEGKRKTPTTSRYIHFVQYDEIVPET
jgi:hypothetical protein